MQKLLLFEQIAPQQSDTSANNFDILIENYGVLLGISKFKKGLVSQHSDILIA
ncbi:hypothetical protein [Arcicella rosea]|uniref:Uncharacterized protein n=1 Tax=Arcicella rosea TaxID=502909 RepID=A0A841ER69_9BACT|nr:hypothetical protein [Arcicella rosea]MBB6003168.1 hypothetical protein [Arcicella rosea]